MVAPNAVGRDATRIGELMADLQLSLHLFGRYGVPIFAMSGLDIALWDIADAAIYAIDAPAHVNVATIELMPIEQAAGGLVIQKLDET